MSGHSPKAARRRESKTSGEGRQRFARLEGSRGFFPGVFVWWTSSEPRGTRGTDLARHWQLAHTSIGGSALRPDNPATPIRRESRKRAGRRELGNFASMPYQQMPAFLKRLRKAAGNSPRCVEFAILTAARTSEALTPAWAEFDPQARTGRFRPQRWTDVGSVKKKAFVARPHRVGGQHASASPPTRQRNGVTYLVRQLAPPSNRALASAGRFSARSSGR